MKNVRFGGFESLKDDDSVNFQTTTSEVMNGTVLAVSPKTITVKYITDAPRTVEFDMQTGKTTDDPNNVWTLIGKKQS